MFTVEYVVSEVRRLAGERDYKKLASFLANNAELLTTIDCRAVVEGLDPQAHSLGFMAALCVKFYSQLCIIGLYIVSPLVPLD